jgi:hypothetical protein
MQKLTRRLLRAALAVVVLVPCSICGFADPIVSIQPFFSTVDTGSFFDVAVNISPVNKLFAFQFDLGFDPAILSAQSVTEGALLPSGGSTFFIPGAIDNSAGTITLTADSLFRVSGVTGSGILATVNFEALGIFGTSSLTLSNLVLLDSALSDIPFTTKGATVNVVPEPSSLLLIGSALIGLIAFQRKSLARR